MVHPLQKNNFLRHCGDMITQLLSNDDVTPTEESSPTILEHNSEIVRVVH